MNTTQITGGTLGDKETINDLIASQKYVSANYNTFANECVSQQLRSDFLNILQDEHNIQADLFNEANSRGWYPVKQAPVNEITQVRQKYAGQ
ncbi:MAG: spore coat protein [Oscillospiraceae bacterium]|jgi:spore coat protein CotF|nr:spore coat protein [Oscillospiraceae bacterium]